ncbi:AmmeMemoRadiSam system protein B [Candidatus Amesbacteria bacterium RIFCSPHIGHO2_02_FULL_47_9]|uniref:AmmeMemoRadiSam system protein B n=1 Tax=Candidatus Amesbacteria bacterium RIFCSPHIGHO2_01_FULL_48_32b TaxID=1797253 RepID=A0A1F4YFV8_9BACT|nr:MAG: AmmeMemoRadiSam system protein B [Candidatus Amesbacteria bacterium RIFCSPHIGHO2_01_FULL_48_32b]OGD04621.1 MAG: AmmeMemoRadiSam system protein B [Candidatus Amesbacteria bacterium RIFCSPHIGHO2_02_FULL_47_9]OGD07565.1 MAG: AmmeMemoRadiSam system protein B [Candidatus Amesbacteria bacterium RIFCSPLOWO2_01_FULL_49_25]
MRKEWLIILLVMLVGAAGGWNHWRGRIAGVQTEKISRVRGIVLPHHELAGEIVMRSLERLAQTQDFSHIVIFSPNHFQPDSYTFSTADKIKDLPLDTKYLRELKEMDANAVWDQKLLENEHGVLIPAGYLKNYFPRASFLPIIFSPYFNQERLDKMAGWLAQAMPADTLFVVSVDFAHEKMAEEAALKNLETIETIKNRDYQRLFGYGNDHLDSPAAMGTWMMTTEKLEAKNWETWYDSHGAMLTDNPLLNGTSYVIGVFTD